MQDTERPATAQHTHTAGPLQVIAPSSYPFHTKAWIVQSPDESLNDCTVTATCTGPDAEGNARLYSAAPTLLGALQMMLDAFPAPRMRAANGFQGNLAHAQARKAIAQALGH